MREGGGEAGGGLTLLVSGGWLSWSPPRGDCPFGTKATRGWDPPSAPLRGPSSPPRYACDPAAAAVGGGAESPGGARGKGGGRREGGTAGGRTSHSPQSLFGLEYFPISSFFSNHGPQSSAMAPAPARAPRASAPATSPQCGICLGYGGE